MVKKTDNKPVILAIETAVGGGSIALLKGGVELDSLAGADNVSRSEDLLLNIADILERNGLSTGHLRHVAVSVGPGSYTGIRVGIATALGLARALGIPCVGVQVLAAMCVLAPDQNKILSAIPIGRDEACAQIYQDGIAGTIWIEKRDALAERLRRAESIAVLHESLYMVPGIRPGKCVINAGRLLARAIGKYSLTGGVGPDLTPVYVRDPM